MFGMSVMVLAGMATYANFPTSCKPFDAPTIRVSYESSPVRYDYSKSVA
jgi:hypothetical protein